MICSMILLFAIFSHYESDKLHAYAKAMISWTFYMYFITEFLSLFGILNRTTLVCGWGIFVVFLAVHLFRNGRVLQCRKCIETLKSNFKMPAEALVLAGIGVMALILAIVTIPYNWDSMTYHLARIAYWREHQTIAHYATNIVRQITSPVLGEFVNLNVYVLMNGDDRLIQLMQCFSYITNTFFVCGISSRLGVGKQGSCLAGFLFMTMPIAFGEALSTQVDHYASLWAFLMVYILMDYLDMTVKFRWDRKSIVGTIEMSTAIAFGYLAKPSVMFAILFFALWLLAVCLKRKDNIWVVLRLLALAVCVIIIILGPEVGRNIYTFHWISDPIAGARQLIGRKNPKYIFMNFVKNFIWNLPSIYWTGSSEQLTEFAHKLADLLKVDINDPGISEDGGVFAMREAQDYGHDTAVNPVIVILFVLCIIWMIYKLIRSEKKTENKMAEQYSKVVTASFLFFCAMLRWEPFVTRYMITYLGLLCPMVAWQFQDFGRKKREWCCAIVGVFLFTSVVEMRGMIIYHTNMVRQGQEKQDRAYGYFHWKPDEVYDEYIEVQRIIVENDYRNIGLITEENSYDYPVFKMLEPYVDRIEHVNVNNTTSIYEDETFIPDCVVIVDTNNGERVSCHGREYDHVVQIGEYVAIVE